VLEDLLAHYPEAAESKPPEGTPVPKVKEMRAPPPGLGAAETRLFEALANGAKGTDELIQVSELPAFEALSALSVLELLGLAVHERGLVKLTVS
jgi:predicted Rossmann fold nucleotide-binding protein DprA/Smf involved in DNA uptake